MFLLLVTSAPILFTPYRGDDTLNRDTRRILLESGELPGALVNSIIDFTQRWMGSQGRFFPGAVTWGQTVFTVLQSRESYKMLLFGLALLMMVLAAVLTGALTRQQRAVAVMIVMLGTTVTIRTWFDGLASFAGLLTLTLSLALGSALLLLRGRGRWSVAVAVLLWSVGLVTYEIVILLTPTICFLVWAERRNIWRALALMWPSLAIGVFVQYLRSQANLVDPAYAIELEPYRLAATFAKQAASALPLSQVWFPGAAPLDIPLDLIVLTLPLVAVPAILALYASLPSGPGPSRRSLVLLTLTGATFWLLPAALIAATVRWQTELPPGQGYLSAVWGYVGVAMLLAAAWLALVRRHRQSPGRLTRSALVVAGVGLGLLVALNFAQTFAVVSSYIPTTA